MKFADLYCRKCRQSHTALEQAPKPDGQSLPPCIGGKAHYFTEEIPPEETLKTHIVPATVH